MSHLARHLDERHPDTVLHLARYAAGQPAATTAQLLDVQEDRLLLTVDGDPEPVVVALPTGPHAPPDVRGRVAALLQATRAALPTEAAVPLTALERQIAARGSHGPRSRLQ